MLVITAFTAGLMLLMQMTFGIMVTANRGRFNIPLGDGGNTALLKHIRVHGNFSEHVPMILIAMGLAEIAGASSTVLWVGAVALIGSRIVHAFAIHGIAREVGIRLGAGTNYLLLALWGGYLLAISTGIVAQ